MYIYVCMNVYIYANASHVEPCDVNADIVVACNSACQVRECDRVEMREIERMSVCMRKRRSYTLRPEAYPINPTR